MSNQTTWRDGVPVSARFDDPYYSLQDGVAETTHVFLHGNALPARFAGDMRIGELGFGTGLNALVTWAAWRAHPGPKGRLCFTSFEAFPMDANTRAQALAAFPALAPLAVQMAKTLQTGDPLEPGVTLRVIHGDARATLHDWDGLADVWFLDGFAPAKNPELWEAPLMQQVFDHTAPGGTVATYTAAGAVRRGLADAGFTVTRVPGFGRKRHMTTGRRDG